MSYELELIQELTKAIENDKVTVTNSFIMQLGEIKGFLIENKEKEINVFVYKNNDKIVIQPQNENQFQAKNDIQYEDLFNLCQYKTRKTNILHKLKNLNQ